MKVLFTPRDANPYQSELIAELARLGVTVDYLPERSKSHTLNVLLMPLELVVARLKGATVLHLHWVYRFALPGSRRWPSLRRLARAWFSLVLGTARLLRMPVVWTGHNVLPHTQVFDDDRAARRALLRSSSAVIVHERQTADALAELGPVPERVATIPQGPVREARATNDLRGRLGISVDARVLGMVGRIERYKGVQDLVDAGLAAPGDHRILLVGACDETALRQWLEQRARRDSRLVLLLERVADEEFGQALATLDISVLPFRAIANSGSATASLNAGVPLLMREGVLPSLPGGAVHRFSDLFEGIEWAVGAPDLELAAGASAALDWSQRWTWADVARETEVVYRRTRVSARSQTEGAAK